MMNYQKYLAYKLTDLGINLGVKRSVKLLQKSVNLPHERIIEDGDIRSRYIKRLPYSTRRAL